MRAAGFIASLSSDNEEERNEDGDIILVEGIMELTLEDVRDLVGMGPSAFHQSEESTHALSNLFRDDDESLPSGSRVIPVTKSFVVQVFRKETS